MDFTLHSIDNIPGINALASFTTDSSNIWSEDTDQIFHAVGDVQYMPWGADNMRPYHVQDLIDRDETMATCQQFNAEICYGGGIEFDTCEASVMDSADLDDFIIDNDIPTYWAGVCQDIRQYGMAVSVIILSKDGKMITDLIRKEACYCRFSPADETGNIQYVHYANWRRQSLREEEVETIQLLDARSPLRDLDRRIAAGTAQRKFAIVTKAAATDNRYYPIPPYVALFRGKWYEIKNLIGIAKEAKLKHHAPIKYHIEIASRYWDALFKAENITDPLAQRERAIKEKAQILDFLTGAENSGKAWFSTFYVTPDGREQHDVVINKVDAGKEGGDWETDIQEAINMICFTMRVHSNLVGSVPGKSQSNNSGSDKRELYTIAQALQKPYRDQLLKVFTLICRFNDWQNIAPRVPFIQLTTLDEHRDAKLVTI